MWAEPFPVFAEHYALVGVVGIDATDDSPGLDNEKRVGGAVLTHSGADAVMPQALDEIIEGLLVQLMSAGQALGFFRHKGFLPSP
ncbi:hypothetical protein D3C76_619240 [compost metagenome]